MGVVAYENADMGIYFVADPDGYWTESFRQVNINGIYVNPFGVVSWTR